MSTGHIYQNLIESILAKMCGHVERIPENPAMRTPDFRARFCGHHLIVEVKSVGKRDDLNQQHGCLYGSVEIRDSTMDGLDARVTRAANDANKQLTAFERALPRIRLALIVDRDAQQTSSTMRQIVENDPPDFMQTAHSNLKRALDGIDGIGWVNFQNNHFLYLYNEQRNYASITRSFYDRFIELIKNLPP